MKINNLGLILICILLGLALGNYVFQCFSQGEWIVALERTFFQLVALLSVWIVFKIKGNK